MKGFYWMALYIFIFGSSCTNDQESSFHPSIKTVFHSQNYYKGQEKFSYTATFGPLKVGALTISSDSVLDYRNEKPCYRVVANATLKGVIGVFSDLNDSWETIVDTTSLLPIKFSRHLQENKYRKNDFAIFYRDQNKVVVTDTTNGKKEEKEFQISPTVEDMISSFYLLRNVPFYQMPEGDTTTIDAFLENKSYNVRIKYLGYEKIKYNGKKIKAIAIAPLIPSEGILSGEYPVRAWISDDDNKIPVKVIVKTSFGSVDILLDEYTKTNSSNKSQVF